MFTYTTIIFKKCFTYKFDLKKRIIIFLYLYKFANKYDMFTRINYKNITNYSTTNNIKCP